MINLLEQTSLQAVNKLTGFNAELLHEGKSSYWARTHIVQSNGLLYFTKQTRNLAKAHESKSEPFVTKIVSEHGIPCPKAHVVYDQDEVLDGSLPTIVYDYQNSPTGNIQDGDDIVERENMLASYSEEQIGKTLSKINQIKPGATKDFHKGLSNKHLQEAISIIENSKHISNTQREESINLFTRGQPANLRLHHQDYYPANLLFDTNSRANLLSITDWEKAQFAPLGTDLLGLIAISSQLFALSDKPVESYREALEISPESMKSLLLTYGLAQAILLANRVDNILQNDPSAQNDPKVVKFQGWIRDYLSFAFRYQ